jgi:hypothetical protein
MPFFILVALALISAPLLHAQERKIPKDSSRISIPGCSKGRTFIVAEAPEHEPVRSEIEAGRRFRLSGPKKLLKDIELHQGSMVEVTGLVRTGQLAGPGGVSIAGGRIRIGGGNPQAGMSDPRRDPLYNQVVIDVESWRQLPESCPAR